MKQREFTPRQVELGAVEDNSARARVKRERADHDGATVASLQRAHACAKLSGPQRTGNHGVGAGIERCRDARAPDGDDDQDGERVARPQARDVGLAGRDDQRTVALAFQRGLDLLMQAAIGAGDMEIGRGGRLQDSSTSRGAMPSPSRAIRASVSLCTHGLGPTPGPQGSSPTRRASQLVSPE